MGLDKLYSSKYAIEQAKTAAQAFKARQAVVIAFLPDGQFLITSYGKTKAECRSVANLTDAIVDALHKGDLPSPLQDPNGV